MYILALFFVHFKGFLGTLNKICTMLKKFVPFLCKFFSQAATRRANPPRPCSHGPPTASKRTIIRQKLPRAKAEAKNGPPLHAKKA